MKELMSNINKQWETLRFNLELTLKQMAEELPDGVNGFRFNVIVGEDGESGTFVNVVEDIEFLYGHRWDAIPEEVGDLFTFTEWLSCQNELLTEGEFSYLKNISRDEL